ncbi:hypothetical protein H6G89_31200 [Oscillatoria sp. FACHB-1407]|uniref:hypothetical protein n=1 Tax=Oscillatoria sp. FACHB-1407 TaxID=2692847 RepID=UPI001682C7B6|nr:hypothetical protein [Oscillatoria sp. FACHB-1407]MBD2465469.1 hypothetical protein [Oscillatoria sp. FACHB-1407]
MSTLPMLKLPVTEPAPTQSSPRGLLFSAADDGSNRRTIATGVISPPQLQSIALPHQLLEEPPAARDLN